MELRKVPIGKQANVRYWPEADIPVCTAKCPLLGGKADMTGCGCLLSRPLLGVKRTWLIAAHMSASDPKRTWLAIVALWSTRHSSFSREWWQWANCSISTDQISKGLQPNAARGGRRNTTGGYMSKGKVLVVGSNATRIETQGGTGPTGNYLNETVVPIMALIDAGYDIVLATPNGTKPHIDEVSDSVIHFGGDQAAYARARAFWANESAMNKVRTLSSVIEEGLDDYAAVFVPGGQAPVVDLMQDPQMGKILRHFHDRAKTTALLCHGPIALVATMPHAP